jgi:hypothetical protein
MLIPLKRDMEVPRCTNYSNCQLISTDSIVSDPQKKLFYIHTYCTRGENAWSNCKRYITKAALSFCPDFVLPDSLFTSAEIIDEFDRLQRDNR